MISRLIVGSKLIHNCYTHDYLIVSYEVHQGINVETPLRGKTSAAVALLICNMSHQIRRWTLVEGARHQKWCVFLRVLV